MLGYFCGQAFGVILLAFLISKAFKPAAQKMAFVICVIVFGLIVIPKSNGYDIGYGSSVEMSVVLSAWGITIIVMLLVGAIFSSIKSEHVKHQNSIEEYRKYVIDCDEKGKPPLSYKKWKFAYSKEAR